MSEHHLPKQPFEQLQDFSLKQRETLRDKLKYPVPTLEEDVRKYYNRLLSENQQDGELKPSKETIREATTVILEKLQSFKLALDELGASAGIVKDNYENLFESSISQETLTQLNDELSIEANDFIAKHETLENQNLSKSDYETKRDLLTYKYLAEKRDLMREEAEIAISDSDIFQFAQPSLETALEAASQTPEAAEEIVKATLRKTPVVKSKRETDFDKKYEAQAAKNAPTIKGIDNIIEGLKGHLSPDDDVTKVFEIGIRQRFTKLEDDNISISSDVLDSISGEVFLKFDGFGNDPEKVIQAIDETATELYNNADFKVTHVFKNDFKSKIGKAQTQQQDNDGAGFGLNGKVAAAGIALSVAGTWASRVAQADGIESQQTKNAQEAKSLRASRNHKLAFATVASVAATALIIDGFVLKGRFSKMIIEGAKNKLSSPSQSL